MPAYLVVLTDRRDETHIEADDLTIELDAHWLTIRDHNGPCYAAPREQVVTVMRVDEPQTPDQPEPAPQKE